MIINMYIFRFWAGPSSFVFLHTTGGQSGRSETSPALSCLLLQVPLYNIYTEEQRKPALIPMITDLFRMLLVEVSFLDKHKNISMYNHLSQISLQAERQLWSFLCIPPFHKIHKLKNLINGNNNQNLTYSQE